MFVLLQTCCLVPQHDAPSIGSAIQLATSVLMFRFMLILLNIHRGIFLSCSIAWRMGTVLTPARYKQCLFISGLYFA